MPLKYIVSILLLILWLLLIISFPRIAAVLGSGAMGWIIPHIAEFITREN